jgi:DNA-binding NarL/FixJ family response regulator
MRIDELALDRLRKAILAEQVRVALRDGLTIAAVQAKHPAATKRFVEEQRAFLRQTEGLADTRRTSTGADVARLTDAGFTAGQIAQTLGVSVSSVYQHRRKQQKCNNFAKYVDTTPRPL